MNENSSPDGTPQNPSPGMPGVPNPSTDQRILAAIVFTDVVGFSKHTGENEEVAINALNRDLTIMREYCAARGGQVLNVMGDGVLMTFPSAVEAVDCATQLQQRFFEQSFSLPKNEVLVHRIGVHVGDVIKRGDNVLGDGVNIAARLQAEAKPGGICMSRSVFDAARKNLTVNAQYLGQRTLRHISEPIQIYVIAPVADQLRNPTIDEVPMPDAARNEGAKGLKAGVLILASLATGLIAAVAVFRAGTAPKAEEPTRPKSELTQKLKDQIQKVKEDNNLPAKSDPNSPEMPNGLSDQQSFSLDQATQDRLRGYVQDYQFDQVVQTLRSNGYGKDTEGAAIVDRYQLLADFRQWLDSEIARSTPQFPILANVELRPVGSGLLEARLYRNETAIVMEASGATTERGLKEFTPASILAIANSASLSPPSGNAAPERFSLMISTFNQEFAMDPAPNQ